MIYFRGSFDFTACGSIQADRNELATISKPLVKLPSSPSLSVHLLLLFSPSPPIPFYSADMSAPAPNVLGINFGSSFASISVIGKEGHAACIANEEGERQIACAISYNGDQIVSQWALGPALVPQRTN